MSVTSLRGARVLMIVAHCDDELICGWPILQEPAIDKTILMVSSDRFSKDRQWCAHRKFIFMDLCKRLGVKCKVLDFNSNFYALPARDGSLLKLERSIARVLCDENDFDYVFTHNPFGEYGHLDHKYLFHITSQLARKPVLISDICIQSDWTNTNELTKRMRTMYFHQPIGEATLDQKFYEKVKQQYDLAKVWTWNQKPVAECKLYLL